LFWILRFSRNFQNFDFYFRCGIWRKRVRIPNFTTLVKSSCRQVMVTWVSIKFAGRKLRQFRIKFLNWHHFNNGIKSTDAQRGATRDTVMKIMRVDIYELQLASRPTIGNVDNAGAQTMTSFFRTDPLWYQKFVEYRNFSVRNLIFTYIHQETRIIRKLFIYFFGQKRSKLTMQKLYFYRN